MEHRRRERVGVEKSTRRARVARKSSYQQWIRAMCVNSQLVHGAAARPADLRVRPPVLRVPQRVVAVAPATGRGSTCRSTRRPAGTPASRRSRPREPTPSTTGALTSRRDGPTPQPGDRRRRRDLGARARRGRGERAERARRAEPRASSSASGATDLRTHTMLPLLAYGRSTRTMPPLPMRSCSLPKAPMSSRGSWSAATSSGSSSSSGSATTTSSSALSSTSTRRSCSSWPTRRDEEQAPLDRVLELLHDVPAGKLAIAELASASRDDVETLERAGVDAVLVTGDVEALVGDAVPDV